MLLSQGRNEFDSFFREHRKALIDFIVRHFNYSPAAVARGIRKQIRSELLRSSARLESFALDRAIEQAFVQRLRKALYARERRPKMETRNTLDAIADLLARSVDGNIAAVITPNFDDLLERQLKARGTPFTPILNGSARGKNGLRIVHSHGFVPRKPHSQEGAVVLAEDEYHRLMTTFQDWASTELAYYLRTHVVLFVGASGTDPDLRLLLDVTRGAEQPAHWILKQRHNLSQDEKQAFFARNKSPWTDVMSGKMGELMLRPLLNHADQFSQSHFEDMGVNTQWVTKFSEICTLLDRIPTGRARASSTTA
jgi:hypothetical protein